MSPDASPASRLRWHALAKAAPGDIATQTWSKQLMWPVSRELVAN
jgi:hypothetical protein